MAETKLDLNPWIARVQKCANAKEVFAVMNEFRREGDWSDQDRARIAKIYVRVLDRVGAPPPDEKPAVEETKDDGPVWYEKM